MTHNTAVAIWDLDNCLADDAWRIPLINWDAGGDERYNAYHAACHDDQPSNLDVFDRFTHVLSAAPLFVTGRPESVRSPTEAWIEKHLGVREPRVMMRGGELLRLPAVELKRRLLRCVPHLHSRFVAAFDDRADIIDMYRADFGIRGAEVLAIHNVCAYTKKGK